MSERFAVGHRVVVTTPKHSMSDVDGYYGHVVAVPTNAHTTSPMVMVSLTGRVSGPVDPVNLDPDGKDPYPFYEHELEHAD